MSRSAKALSSPGGVSSFLGRGKQEQDGGMKNSFEHFEREGRQGGDCLGHAQKFSRNCHSKLLMAYPFCS